MYLSDSCLGAFTGLIKEHNIRISMDGQVAWRDNVFVERFSKSVKYANGWGHF